MFCLTPEYSELHSINKKKIFCLLSFLCHRDKSSTSNMKIDTLAFLGCILAQHLPKVFHPHIHVLVPVSIQCFVSYDKYHFSAVSTVKPWDHFKTFRKISGFGWSFQGVIESSLQIHSIACLLSCEQAKELEEKILNML